MTSPAKAHPRELRAAPQRAALGGAASREAVAPPSLARVPELDGIRGLAILLVLLLHYIAVSQGGELGSALYRFRQLFRLGWSGVDLFFVLSGFLIGGILLDARRSPGYFRTFYLRRALRIVPIYYLWLALYAVVLLAAPRLAGARAADFTGTLPLGIYFLWLQNFFLAPESWVVHYWVSITWSLAVEEQFYLLAPMVVRWLEPRRLAAALGGAILLAPALRVLLLAAGTRGIGYAYVLMPCRTDALAMGMLAALAWRTPAAREWLERYAALRRGALGVLLAGLAVMWKWFPGPDAPLTLTLGYTWLALFYVLFLLEALLGGPRGWAGRVTRSRWLRELGTLAYGVYLVHFAVLGGLHRFLLGGAPRVDTLPGVGVTLAAAALTLAITRASWIFFERPLVLRGHAYRY